MQLVIGNVPQGYAPPEGGHEEEAEDPGHVVELSAQELEAV
jgi:hypothetical protein